MILAAAVITGFAAGFLRAWIGKRTYQIVSLRLPGLVIFAFIPQWIAFYQSRMGLEFPDALAPVLLVSSQILLLLFTSQNLKKPGFLVMGAGLLMNFVVTIMNGGLMPISPEMVRRIYPGVSENTWQVGSRLGNGKDVVLPIADTYLWIFSDRFFFPEWFGYRLAFSPGDVLIALGVFWLLWTLGGKQNEHAA